MNDHAGADGRADHRERPRTRPASGYVLLSPDRGTRHRIVLAAGVGAAGELAAIGLLATGAWLLLSAAFRPPILLLSAAIAAVQLFSLLRGCARYGERLASHDMGLRLQARLRTWLYRRLARLLPAGLPGGDRGDLLARLMSDTEDAQDLMVRAAVPAAAIALAWLAAAATAAALLPVAGAAILAAGLAGAAGAAAATAAAGRRAAALPAARGAVGTWALEALTSAEELVALGAADWALARLTERERVLGQRTGAVAAVTGLARAASAAASGAGLAGVAWAGAAAVTAGRIGPVEFGTLVFLALAVAGLLQGLPDALGRLPVSRASLRRLAGIDGLPDPVAEPAAGAEGTPGTGASAGAAAASGSPSAAKTSPAPMPRPAPAGLVVFRQAAIAYPGRDMSGSRPVLSDLDLELAPGRPVALAGPSGSGKTSIVMALLRFVDLSGGEMTIDGTDARALPADQVRALMAWSPEQPRLFPATLRANLRLGAPDASDQQIEGVLADLRLGPWLGQLDRGLDTVLAPWGHPVSGGELQRLSLARALLADRPVLLLDEPTSHLDDATADAVLATVLSRTAGRSLLWVTHRMADLARFPEVRCLPVSQAPLSRLR
jgi:thiol reductant ABC exporter CydC subunit